LNIQKLGGGAERYPLFISFTAWRRIGGAFENTFLI
jgi:hypothetical protein